MRIIFYNLAIVFGILLTGAVNAQESYAQESMCYPPSYEKIVNDSYIIFTGTTISKEPSSHQWDLSEKLNHTNLNVKFEVDDVFSGTYKNFLNISTSEGYDLDDKIYPFTVGEKYFVVASNSSDNDYMTEVYGNNTLIAHSSFCSNTLVIPISSGLSGINSSKNCPGDVHIQCHEQCRLEEYRWTGEGIMNQFSCFNACYDANAEQCHLKLDSLKSQLSRGMSNQNIQCPNNLQLVLKSSDNSPACVKSQTAEKLVKRGWTNIR